MSTNFRNRMARQHDFAMIPRSDIPRSTYAQNQNRKQTFDAGLMVPIYCEEIVPGDHFQGESTLYARLATPLVPVLDNAEVETFWFYVPNRILWDNWEDFIAGGNYTIPIVNSPAGGFPDGDIYDQFGIPCASQIAGTNTISVNALPLRAYNKIWNAWFRDENLVTAIPEHTDNGPDTSTDYVMRNRLKKHDYFTSSLPWPQKGTAVTLPLGTTAPIRSNGFPASYWDGLSALNVRQLHQTNGSTAVTLSSAAGATSDLYFYQDATGLVADLSAATSATINALRTSFQVQRLLERDARGGTRYTELIQSHFGVRPEDYRLDRPEYIGGGRTAITTTPVPQTSGTGATGQDTPQGNLAAFTTARSGGHRFQYAAKEHGYIIGLANVRADLTYQQGLRKHWQRRTRYDFYFPAFAHLGEQAVLNREIYCDGSGNDANTFGYQERWAEYRYTPNEITGLFRSTVAQPLDIWHYSEEFGTLPALNTTFIIDPSATTIARSLAVDDSPSGSQILLDILHQVRTTRPMPTYSVPGLIDHF